MKLFILEPTFSNKSIILAEKLHEINNELKICPIYSSLQSNESKHIEYMKIEEINLSFKNNALLYIDYNNNDITCITIDNFYNNDLIPIKLHEFNNIINAYLNDILVIWLDCNNSKDINKKELRKNITATKHLLETIDNNNIKYLYFLKEDINDIANVIDKYLNSGDEIKKEIEIEFS
jgi:hypothetical protein